MEPRIGTILEAWNRRREMYAEGDKLHAEGYKLYTEGKKLYTEGRKLYAEGDKLRAEGEKLYAEGHKLCAEGEKLYAEGEKLYAEGDKLYAEGRKLRAEGDKLYAEGDLIFINAVIENFENIDIEVKWEGKDAIVNGVRYEREPKAPESCEAMSSYRLISGEVLDLSLLTAEEERYLWELSRAAKGGSEYFDLLRRVKGKGALPLRGGAITPAIAGSVLYRAAHDVADRVGIEQGFLLAPDMKRPRRWG